MSTRPFVVALINVISGGGKGKEEGILLNGKISNYIPSLANLLSAEVQLRSRLFPLFPPTLPATYKARDDVSDDNCTVGEEEENLLTVE